MKKRIFFAIIMFLFLFSATGCMDLEKYNNAQQSSIEEKEEDKLDNVELFGEKDAYYNHEKNIREYVINYNSKATNKVKKVNWKNNHTIAYLQFNDEQCKINDHSEMGYIFTCDFKNGQAKISDYESIFKDIILLADSNVSEDSINNSLAFARDNNLTVTNITDKITIKYSYIKDAVSISSGDRYIIELIIGK